MVHYSPSAASSRCTLRAAPHMVARCRLLLLRHTRRWARGFQCALLCWPCVMSINVPPGQIYRQATTYERKTCAGAARPSISHCNQPIRCEQGAERCLHAYRSYTVQQMAISPVINIKEAPLYGRMYICMRARRPGMRRVTHAACSPSTVW